MQRNQHSNEFKEQALSEVRARGSRTLQTMATELNTSLGTLKGWLKRSGLEGTGLASGQAHTTSLPGDLPARLWSPVQRLLALQESHALSGPALHAWCREKGLFEHQLVPWRDAFCAPTQAPASNAANTAVRELQARHAQLQREMLRKDRALAEAAALLVLQPRNGS